MVFQPGLRDLLIKLSSPEEGRESDDAEWRRKVLFSLQSEIESCGSIDLHYSGHAKERPLDNLQLLVLVSAMQEVDLSRLQILNLSGCFLENQKIITMLADLMSVGDLPALKYLDLSGNYTLKEDGSAALARALKSGKFSNLEHLGLPRCNIDDMVRAIQEGNVWQLRYLIFSGTSEAGKSRPSIHKLFETGHLSKITKLVIKSRSIDSPGVDALAKALHYRPVNTQLQTLDLSLNILGDAGSRAVSMLIQDGNLGLLQHLRLSSCSIDGNQMETIAQGFESGQLYSLEHLDLSWNKFKDQGALAVARVLQAGHLASLRRLNLGYCEVGTEFRLRHGIVAVLEALGEGHLAHLESLNLLGNQIGQGAAIMVANTIVEIVEAMPALQFVNIIDGRHGNRALTEALDLVLRYPVSDFTAVYCGLKRKTEVELCQAVHSTLPKHSSLCNLQQSEDRTFLRQYDCLKSLNFNGERMWQGKTFRSMSFPPT